MRSVNSKVSTLVVACRRCCLPLAVGSLLVAARSASADVGAITLGGGANPGALTAANGLVVKVTETITGYGTIHSPNTLADRTLVDGIAHGKSPAEPLTFTGHVKGVGTFDHVEFTGTFDPGHSPAILTVGNLAFGPTSTLIMELGGPNPGIEHDQILSSGTLAFDGTLSVVLIDSFVPSIGQSFNLFDWNMRIGAFDNVNLPTLTGAQWDTTGLYPDGLLEVIALGLLGDYNGNDIIDAADYTVWRDTLTASGSFLLNDPTPGTVDETDFEYWRDNFGESLGSGAGSVAAIPEPSTHLLLCFGALGATALRRYLRGL